MSARKPPRGRQFFANPGPTNIPDSVLRAIDRPAQDFMDESFTLLVDHCISGLKKVLGTSGEVFMYTASGHGAWEASLLNLFSPGERLLMLESGYFSNTWAEMARRYGLEVQMVPCDRRRGADAEAVRAALAADTGHAIKGVCTVHNETSTGVTLPLPAIRKALDETGHPALLLSDTISSLGCIDFRMDEWGIDCAVGGGQKGLMLPTGLSFTGVSKKGMAAHAHAKLPRFYLDWSIMMTRRHRSFVGTIPTQPFHGLKEALRLIEEEGIDQLYARHTRLAEATRTAVRTWSGNQGPQLFCIDPARLSNSVTAVLMPEGHSSEAVRAIAQNDFNVSLGGGLGELGGKVFRIGHLGDLNEPMILGTLAAVEMSLVRAGVPHGKGGVAAAMDMLAA